MISQMQIQKLFRVMVRDAGESLEAIIAADPLADMTELESFMKKENVIAATWRSLGGEI